MKSRRLGGVTIPVRRVAEGGAKSDYVVRAHGEGECVVPP